MIANIALKSSLWCHVAVSRELNSPKSKNRPRLFSGVHESRFCAVFNNFLDLLNIMTHSKCRKFDNNSADSGRKIKREIWFRAYQQSKIFHTLCPDYKKFSQNRFSRYISAKLLSHDHIFFQPLPLLLFHDEKWKLSREFLTSVKLQKTM